MNDIIADLKSKISTYETVFGCVRKEFYDYYETLSADIIKCKDPEIRKMLEKRLNELGSAIKILDL